MPGVITLLKPLPAKTVSILPQTSSMAAHSANKKSLVPSGVIFKYRFIIPSIYFSVLTC